jgi:hypothetical protein
MTTSVPSRLPDERTLFHLIPLNAQAQAAVRLKSNSPYVSFSPECGRDGLEVGFHIPRKPRGDVITRLGRDADLILDNPTVSSRHVEFKLNMHSHVVMLRVLSKDEASVSVILRSTEDAGVEDIDMSGVEAPEHHECRDNWGDCVLLYRRSYLITICDYKFNLIWVDKSDDQLKALALHGQKISEEEAKKLPRRKAPTTTMSVSYLRSRPGDVPECLLREAAGSRELKHESAFTTVHNALDDKDGNHVIVVTIKLNAFKAQRKDAIRSAINQEVTFLKKCGHVSLSLSPTPQSADHSRLTTNKQRNIISCLGSKDFETDQPIFYINPADGDSNHLSETQKTLWQVGLGERMLLQILDALAYLAENNMSHGSIEPAKILYTYSRAQNKTEMDKYDFQLSHFGISKYAMKPPSRFRAPELWDENEPDPAKLVTPKTDVWCLLAAYAATHPSTQRDISQVSSLSALCQVMGRVRQLWPLLNPMAIEDPQQRASATQMIHFLAGLEGPGQPPVAPAPAPLSLGAGGPTDGPADTGGQELEPAIIHELRYNMRNRGVSQRASQRGDARRRQSPRRETGQNNRVKKP